jgi:hypothetical protein
MMRKSGGCGLTSKSKEDLLLEDESCVTEIETEELDTIVSAFLHVTQGTQRT